MAIGVNSYSITQKEIMFDELIKNEPPAFRTALLKAKKLQNKGEISLAMDLLLDLANMYPHCKATFILLGNLYWGKDDLKQAQAYFRKAVELDPQWEIASLALYHTLWSNGLHEEALEEMKRFVQVGNSDEYDRILQAFADDGP